MTLREKSPAKSQLPTTLCLTYITPMQKLPDVPAPLFHRNLISLGEAAHSGKSSTWEDLHLKLSLGHLVSY